MDDQFYELKSANRTTEMWRHRSHERELVFRHGHVAITNYELDDNRQFEKDLSVWDEVNWRYRRVAGYYVPEVREFRVPRGIDTGFLAKHFRGYRVRVDNEAYPADRVRIDLMTPPRDDFQRVGLSFTCSRGDYKRNSDYTTLMVDAETGAGKTFLGTATTCFMQARTIIVVPIGKLLAQWRDSYLQFTSLGEEEILIVKGSKMCKKILSGEYPNVKVFIFSIDTIDSFVKNHGNLAAMEMFIKTNAYLKIIDEVHRNLGMVSMVEALTNCRMTIYMSASPGRVDGKEQFIFNSFYHNVPRFGAEFKVQEEKHLDVMVCPYRFIPNASQVKRMVHPRTKWLNGNAYEKELLAASDEQSDFYVKLIAMLRWSSRVVRDGNRILILCNSVEGTARMKEVAETVFPGEVAQYYGGMKPKDKERALEYRVICATSKSLGTGADIPNLQHIYNVASYSSWIDAVQLPGRGRRLKDGSQVVYIELVNYGYLKTFRQFEKRKPILARNTRTGKIFTIQ